MSEFDALESIFSTWVRVFPFIQHAGTNFIPGPGTSSGLCWQYHNPNLITSTSRFPFPCLNTPVSVGQRPHRIQHIQLLAIHTPCLMSLNADPTRPRTSLVTARKHATKSSFPRDLGEIVPFHAYHIFGSLCRIPCSHHYLSLSIYQQNAHRHGRAFKRSTFDPPPPWTPSFATTFLSPCSTLQLLTLLDQSSTL